jgi:hypothetical protein
MDGQQPPRPDFKKVDGETDVEIKRIGHMNNFRRYNQTYDPSGIVEALDTASGGGHQPCVVNKDISYAIDANYWKGTSFEDFSSFSSFCSCAA